MVRIVVFTLQSRARFWVEGCCIQLQSINGYDKDMFTLYGKILRKSAFLFCFVFVVIFLRLRKEILDDFFNRRIIIKLQI